jgi:hypothetical protein
VGRKTCLAVIKYKNTYAWDVRNAHRILAGKAVGKKPFDRLLHDGGMILKLILMRRGVGVSPWIKWVMAVVSILVEPKPKHKKVTSCITVSF